MVFVPMLALASTTGPLAPKSPAYPIGYIAIDDATASPWDISLTESNGHLLVTSVGTNPVKKNGRIWEASPSDSKFREVSIRSEETQDYYALSSHVYDPSSKRMYVCSNEEVRSGNLKRASEIIYPSVVVFELSSDGDFVWVGSTNFIDKPGQHCGGVTIVNGIIFATNQYATDTSYPALYAADISSGTIPATMSVVQSYSDLGYGDKETVANHDLVTSARAKYTQGEGTWSIYLLDSGRTRILGMSFSKQKEPDSIKRSGDIDQLILPSEIKVPIALYNYNDDRFFLSADIVNIYFIGRNEKGDPEIFWKAQAPSLVTGLAVVSEEESQDNKASRMIFTASPVLVEGEYRISKFPFPVHTQTQYKTKFSRSR